MTKDDSPTSPLERARRSKLSRRRLVAVVASFAVLVGGAVLATEVAGDAPGETAIGLLPESPAPSVAVHDPVFSTEADCAQYRAWLSDNLSGCLWHLDWRQSFGGQLGARPVGGDINIGNAWTITKGGNVNVAVVDDTWNPNHQDIAENVDQTRSRNYGRYPLVESQAAHATRTAGIIAARDNGIGGRGIAPRATLFNYNLVEDTRWGNQADAMRRNADAVAVSNNSYGLVTGTPEFKFVTDEWWEAVDTGLARGFGGLGTSYVFSAGNDKSQTPGDGDVNVVGYHAHPGVISACAVDNNGQETTYSHTGVGLWVCAPSNDLDVSTNRSVGNGLLAPIGSGSYSSYGRTSAATAEVSGAVALIRSANPYLSWRDVKLILAQTAQKNDPAHPGWADGARHYGSSNRRYSFNPTYGFGVVDASAAVNAALSWPRLPALVSGTARSAGPAGYDYAHQFNCCQPSPLVQISDNEETTELTLEGPSNIDFLEHVGVTLYMNSTHARDLRIELVSPSGTESTLIEPISARGHCWNVPFDHSVCALSWKELKLSSNQFLGEDPDGTWTLKITDELSSPSDGYARTSVFSWRLDFLGHQGASTDTTPRARLRVNNENDLDVRVREGSTVRVTASLSGGTLSRDAVIPISLVPGSASAPGGSEADYSPSGPLHIRIRAGQRSGTATFTVSRDNRSELDETLTVKWPDPGSRTSAGSILYLGDPIEVTIIGDRSSRGPSRTVTLQATPATVNEGSSVRITATLTGGAWNRAIYLPVGFDPGTATPLGESFSDYSPLLDGQQAVTGITIPAGQTSATYTIDTSDDDNWLPPEPPETFSLVVNRPTALTNHVAVVGSPLVITIVDDDPPPPPLFSGGGCVESLSGDGRVSGSWSSGCGSQERDGRFARFFTFTLAQASDVRIGLGSAVDAYLYVRRGDGVRSGPAVFSDDDGGQGRNSLIDRRFAAGAYTVEATTYSPRRAGSFTLDVSGLGDTAPPPVIDPPPVVPVVGVSGGSAVVEGSAAVFTLRAAPAPVSPLSVSVRVSGVGGFVSGGPRVVTIPVSGSATLRVPTSGDSVDEPDGSVSVSVGGGSGYDVSSAQGSASVVVRDDDDPPPPPPPLFSGGGCVESLSGDGRVSGSWSSGCGSQERDGRFARFFTFTLAQASDVRIGLGSAVDAYLYVRRGDGVRSGPAVFSDDDGGQGRNSLIDRRFAAGAYTVEATTYSPRRAGSFTLDVSGLGDTAPPPVIDPPTVVHRDNCVETISLGAEVAGSLTRDCDSQFRSGRHARYYEFTLTSRSSVRVSLGSSSMDTYVYLRRGADERAADLVAVNDDGGRGTDSLITEVLDPGAYTVEATTYPTGSTGSFRLLVSTAG